MPSSQSSKYQIFYVPAAIFLGSLAVVVSILVTGGLGNEGASIGADSQKQETASVSVDDDQTLGDVKAPITIVEFSDYQCSFCQSFQSETLPQIKSEYIDKGLVRFAYRDFPLSSIGHVSAGKAAEAAHCAGDQGKYWEMHDKLFNGQQDDWGYYEQSKEAYLPLEKALSFFKAYAREIGIDGASFDSCLDSEKYAEEVAKDFADGASAGVSGTPTFFVGKSDPSGTFTGQLVSGAQPFESFKQLIDGLLSD